ncbi:DNA topoisomerase-3 [Brevibacillus aydinogluensis]|jgi:DNA topoisomerase III|uniref:type IA DNA topoisomerase n=1 Tax=Brevibacillus aydinogluensis TaxID=927786 RepID=UPI002892D29B|nr:DNA topoisomerase 3 [Brevibacillus aydinogluensis]MDT3417152.1 DNA topoisomerase-3 [Brevibacillus aydinogluensis]
MSILILAEKPSAAKAIAEAILGQYQKYDGYFQNDTYTVTWAVGHLIGLADPEEYDPAYSKWDLKHLPIIPDPIKLSPNGKTLKQLKIIEKLASSCTGIVNAMDCAREGELIFGYIMEYLKIQKPVKRLWTSSLTPDAIRKAFGNMKNGIDYHHLLQAARARSLADWLIGINATRAFSAKHKELLTIGRVQTPVLAMIYDRQVAIEGFQKTKYYDVEAVFQQGFETYTGIWQGQPIFDPAAAEGIALKVKGKPAQIVDFQVHDSEELPPKLYDLTSLQQEANAKHGFSAQKTLEIAQGLYEKQAITYPRTSSSYVDESNVEFMQKVFDLIIQTPLGQRLTQGADRLLVNTQNKNLCRPDKIEDHHAILPTEKLPDDMTDDEEKLYEMILRRYLAHFFSAAKFRHFTIITVVEQERFKTHIKEVKEPGWKRVHEVFDDDDPDQGPQIQINFSIKPDQPLQCIDGSTKEKETKPPRWYTEGTLVAAMKTAGKEIQDPDVRDAMKDSGLGTPATRAGIIERLKEVGYIENKGKRIMVTAKGRATIELIRKSGIQLLTSPEMTGIWEKKLNEISRNEFSAQSYLDTVKDFTRHIINVVKGQQSLNPADTKKTLGKCPICQEKVVETPKAYACSKQKEGCKFVVWKEISGRKITEKVITDLLEKGKTAYLTFISKKGENFEARLVLQQDGTTKFEFPIKSKSKRG